MKKIAVCGCGLRYFERIELFDQIKKLAPVHDVRIESFVQAAIMHLLVPYNKDQIDIATFSGSVLRSSVFYPKLLHNVDAVVYIVSGMIPKAEGRNHVRSIDIEQQLLDFQQYVKAASQVGVLWNKVPWIWILTEDLFGSYVTNKVEMTLENPLLNDLADKLELPERFPSSFRDDIIVCHMAIGEGVDILWKRIVSTIFT